MKQKIAGLILSLTLLITPNMTFANSDLTDIAQLNDVNNHWSKPYVTKLLATGIISGYDDGTFKPERTTTRAEFLRMLISAIHEDPGVNTVGGGMHWAKNYEDVAIEKGYLTSSFIYLDAEITREEIATLVSRAMNEMPSNFEEMKKVFHDYPRDVEITNHIAKVAGLGLIKGYADGTFKPNNLATRAEVSTILIRLLDTSEREIPVKVEKPVNKGFIEPIFKVRHYIENRLDNYQAGDLGIFIDNQEQYDELYKYKVECINIPELNEIDYLVWGDTKNYIRSRRDIWLPLRYIRDDGSYYERPRAIWHLNGEFYTTQENMDKVNIYIGTELQFKISIRKGDILKEYYFNTIVEQRGLEIVRYEGKHIVIPRMELFKMYTNEPKGAIWIGQMFVNKEKDKVWYDKKWVDSEILWNEIEILWNGKEWINKAGTKIWNGKDWVKIKN